MRRVCGLDVHKDSIYMCILYENGSKIESVFGVLTPELYKVYPLMFFRPIFLSLGKKNNPVLIIR